MEDQTLEKTSRFGTCHSSSMSRRWVVVSEENFNELCEKKKERKHNQKDELEETKQNKNIEEYQPEKGATEPTSEQQQNVQINFEPNKENSLEPDKEENSEIERFSREPSPVLSDSPNRPNRNLEEVFPERKVINNLPLSYQQCGLKLLQTLQETNEFGVNIDGEILIKDNPIPNYSLEQFFRTTCIPFHKSDIPLSLQSWLREKNITKFRNHLARIRPNWVNKYGSRASTMARRPGPTGAR